MIKLTAKQIDALRAASSGDGTIFQLPESRRHSQSVLSSLVKRGLLKAESVGVIWTLTPTGREAVESLGEPPAEGAKDR